MLDRISIDEYFHALRDQDLSVVCRDAIRACERYHGRDVHQAKGRMKDLHFYLAWTQHGWFNGARTFAEAARAKPREFKDFIECLYEGYRMGLYRV